MKKNYFLWLLFLLSFTKTIGQNNYIDSLKQQLALEKDDTGKVKLLFQLSNTYLFSYADTSAQYAKLGLELAQKVGDKKNEVGCLNMLGLSLSSLGNFTGALSFGFKALALSESMHDTLLLVYSNNNLMKCYLDQEDYKEALVYGYSAQKLLTSPHSTSQQATVVLGLIAAVYENMNQLDSALYYAEKSRNLPVLFSTVRFSIGNIYTKTGNYDLALKYYREGIAIAEDQATYTDLVNIYNGMSKVFDKMGKMDSAIYYANRAIIQKGIQAYPEGKLQAAEQLARLYELKGNADSTIKFQKLTIDLKNNLFSRQKTREAQNFAFNEKLHQQELTAQQQQDKNKIKIYALLAAIILFITIVFILWRNNAIKQKANSLLQQKNIEIESTLTELKSTQAQLIQKEKMASLGELTAGIAHEIQNPLNFVNNFSEVNKELLQEMKDEMKKGNMDDANTIANNVIENQEKINHHGKRAEAIVKGMLQHSQTNTGKKEPTAINKLADEYLRLSYHGLRAKDNSFNVTLKTDYDETAGNINIIPQDIGRVLLNLYNNAFYAASQPSKGGSAGPDKNNNPTIWVSTKKMGDKVFISVKDNGPGIPQKIVDKIFQPFFTTKPTGQGTGLGLSLAYDIVKAHEGEIKVKTKEGEGTEFIIQLPTS